MPPAFDQARSGRSDRPKLRNSSSRIILCAWSARSRAPRCETSYRSISRDNSARFSGETSGFGSRIFAPRKAAMYCNSSVERPSRKRRAFSRRSNRLMPNRASTSGEFVVVRRTLRRGRKKVASRLSNFIIPESGRDRNLCASTKWCIPAPLCRSASLFHQPMYLLVITGMGNPLAPAARLQNSAPNRLLRVAAQARNNFSKPTRTKGNILRHREPDSITPGREGVKKSIFARTAY